MIRPPPRSSLFPYTTRFRSVILSRAAADERTAGRAGSAHAAFISAKCAMGAPPASSASIAHLARSEEHTSELQSLRHLVCRLLLEKKKKEKKKRITDRLNSI